MDPIQYEALHRAKAAVQLATAVVVVYDHLTTIDREVELIWARKRSLAQVFFVINRYVGDAIYIYATLAFAWSVFQTWGLNVVIWSMQVIMQYRVSSMYHHSRKVIYPMVFVFALEVIAMAVILGTALGKVFVKSEVIPGLTVIQVAEFPPWYFTIWIPSIFMEALVFGLALRAGFTMYTAESRTVTTSSDPKRPSLTFVLLRDSILFPFIAFLGYTLSVAGWRAFPDPGGQMAVSVAGVVACVLGPRLMLNLREAYYMPFMDEYDQARGQFSTPLEFQNDLTIPSINEEKDA